MYQILLTYLYYINASVWASLCVDLYTTYLEIEQEEEGEMMKV